MMWRDAAQLEFLIKIISIGMQKSLK